jgi:hypothetical protein
MLSETAMNYRVADLPVALLFKVEFLETQSAPRARGTARAARSLFPTIAGYEARTVQLDDVLMAVLAVVALVCLSAGVITSLLSGTQA